MRKLFYKPLIFVFVSLGLCSSVKAQRQVDKIDRGLVAVKSAKGIFTSWRKFGEEYYDVTYNLYRDGALIKSGLKASNYVDTGGNAGSTYQVSAVVRGKEQEKCLSVKTWKDSDGVNPCLRLRLAPVYDRKGNVATSDYYPNDVSVADVDGDGVVELLVKRICSYDDGNLYPTSNTTRFDHLEAYKLDGTRLWWIDMGPNTISSGSVETDIISYDWDGDGKSEVIVRVGDGGVIHKSDGTTVDVGKGEKATRYGCLQEGNMTYQINGAEYLLYLEGATGNPYSITNFPCPRGSVDDWGDGYGHRSNKFFYGAPYLDGRKPSIFIGRGAYTKHHFVAMDVNPETHELTKRWEWKSGNTGSWFGQGYHNFCIADVDMDGRDEIVFGSMVIDDNGKGLSTTGLGHGDAQHVGDFDPYRHGLEFFACNETSPSCNYRDATTSEILYRLVGSSDDGRGIAGNFINTVPGAQAKSTQSGNIGCTSCKLLPFNYPMDNVQLNFRIYWDGDLCEETVASPGTERECVVYKPNGGRIFQSNGGAMCNWTKNTPCCQADILGDWREELIVRSSANDELRIYTTTDETPYDIYTLWHDHQYRNGVVWEMCGYNQPPHTSFYLGELEGLTQAPPPLIMNGRVEVPDASSIGSSLDGQHLIVCENNNTTINIEEGVAPYILTFNVPSHVQGNVATGATSQTGKITYDYFTCNVTGGSPKGDMRLVKQGEGILSLPSIEYLYSGNTDIWAGTVNFDGKLPNSRVWIERFAQLNTSGSYGKSIEMNYASVLRPGNKELGSVTIADSLILNFGSQVEFDVYSEDLKSDFIKAKALNIGTVNWNYGPEFSSPLFNIVCHNLEGETELAAGKYKLMEVDEVIGSLSDIVVKGISGRKVYLSYEDNAIFLNIEGIRDASEIFWSGIENNLWDFAGTQNFVSRYGDAEVFVENDKVHFTDDAQNFSIDLTGELPCDTIVVENETNDYTFGGKGAITGSSVLIKKGAGKLTIKNDNSYNGGTHILGGTVQVASLSNATQANGNLGAVVSAASKFTIENGAALSTTSAVTTNSPIKLIGEEGGVLINSADFIMNKQFLGTRLVKKGAGWLKLYQSNGALERLVVSAGVVDANAETPAKVVEMQGGTLNLNSSSSIKLEIPAGKSSTVKFNADRGDYSTQLIGAGTVTINYPLVNGGSWFATRANFKGNWSAFEGTVKAVGVSGDGRFCLNNSLGMPKGTINISAGTILQSTGLNYPIGCVTGSGSLGEGCSLSSAAPGTTTWTVGNDSTDFTFDGKVTGTSTKFVKTGDCTMTVKGAWDNTGSVTIQKGRIFLSGSASLGKGTLTVKPGAVLSGSLSGTGAINNSSVTVEGEVQVGTSSTATSGNLKFAGKNVTFSSGSLLRIGASRCATDYSNGCGYIHNIGKLTFDGTIEIYVSRNTKLAAGDSIRIWQDVQTFSGTPSFIFPEGYEFDTSRISEGILYVTSYDGIDTILSDEVIKEKAYDLTGRKASATRKGIVIVGGKKILRK